MSHMDDFLSGWVPDELELEGDWAVHGLIGPLPLRFLGHTKIFSRAFDQLFDGNNKFLGMLKTGHYEASIGPSTLDPELEVIRIDYDTPKNPWIMRGLVDEVRFIEGDKMLGRGVYQPHGYDSISPRNIFWFTVTKM